MAHLIDSDFVPVLGQLIREDVEAIPEQARYEGRTVSAIWAERLFTREQYDALINALDGPYAETGSVAVVFNPRELATVMAAVRAWQDLGPPHDVDSIMEIASNAGAFEPLTYDEAEALCDVLNGG